MSAYTLALLLCAACSLTVQTAHAATTSGSNIYEFDLTLTWGTSMTYTDADGKIWVSKIFFLWINCFNLLKKQN